jgi:hypothetical protein
MLIFLSLFCYLYFTIKIVNRVCDSHALWHKMRFRFSMLDKR